MNLTIGDVSFVVRDMQLPDLSQVLTIEQTAHSHPWSAQHFESSIASSHHCHLLTDDDQCIAYCITSTAADEAELLNIAVATEYQRRGIARSFLYYVSQLFDQRVRTVFLEVRLSNSPAIALYQSLGFNEVGHRPNYYPAVKGREDALIMAKSL